MNETLTSIYGGRATVHFEGGKAHRYSVSVPELGVEKILQPSVTAVIELKDKSGPLCGWVANQCELYGQMELEKFQAEELGAEQIPLKRVTEILAEMKRAYRKAKRQAGEIGTVVHDYLYRYMQFRTGTKEDVNVTRPALKDMPEGATAEMVEKVNLAIDAGVEWITQHDLVPVTMETPVWSPSHGYIGTEDFIGLVDGQLCVCDYKTSKYLYPEVWLQTAAYQAAYQEEYAHLMIEARWGINVGKDGKLTAIKRDSFWKEDLAAFLGLKQVWEWHQVHVLENEPPITVGALPVKKEAKRVSRSKAVSAK